MTRPRLDMPVENLKKYFAFDPETGVLKWIVKHGNRRPGHVAGCLTDCGYLVASLDGIQYRVHRIGWALHYGEWPVSGLDHINTDKTDNRIVNLRLASDWENQANVGKMSKPASSVHKGVVWHKKSQRWRARIRVHGRGRLDLGCFKNEEDAARAYAEAAALYHGEFMRL